MRSYAPESESHGSYGKSVEWRFDMPEHIEALRWWFHKERTSPNPRWHVLQQRRAELARHDEKP